MSWGRCDAVVEIPEMKTEFGISEQLLQNPLVKVNKHTVPGQEETVQVNVDGEVGRAILEEGARPVRTMNRVLPFERARITIWKSPHQNVSSLQLLQVGL